MTTIPHYVCGVIPDHMLIGVAERAGGAAAEGARATIDHMREVATGRAHAGFTGGAALAAHAVSPHKRRRVLDAQHRFTLTGTLARSEGQPRSPDLRVNEAYDTIGAAYDFYARLFHRNSIDGAGMPLDATVHYGPRFGNVMWTGTQVVYGDGDGRIFLSFTRSLEVSGHEQTHGVTQHSAALGYSGQSGAVNEHLADAFGMMIKQYTLGLPARESDWRFGSDLLGPDVRGNAIRSMATPGAAYDDPVLGRDPQPWHMRDYVVTGHDHGGVHINSGILNHGFYRAAIELGGNTWDVLGRIWYVVMTARLFPDATFHDFTRATVGVAGELFGHASLVQQTVAKAWCDVGLDVELTGPPLPIRRRREGAAAMSDSPASAARTAHSSTDNASHEGESHE
jgi:Zn-dependent metalloprotease